MVVALAEKMGANLGNLMDYRRVEKLEKLTVGWKAELRVEAMASQMVEKTVAKFVGTLENY